MIATLKSGQFYRRFKAKNGREVVLRSLKWEDIDSVLRFADDLHQEWENNLDFGVPMSKKPTFEEEARWLADSLVSIEQGKQVCVVAEVDGKFAGCSQVDKSHIAASHYGNLGISISREFRDIGIGSEMMKTLLDESRKAGLAFIELKVFSSNPGAIHVYEKIGFKQVGRVPSKVIRNGNHIDDIIMTVEL